jgi:5-amino-6-(5-phospho-D-ribitylamino)uracil phosphatase
MSVRAKFLDHLHDDEHPEHTVRVGACAPSAELHDIESSLAQLAGNRGVIHNFPAVVAPIEATHHARGRMHIIELFDAQATKWSGISHVATQLSIPLSRVAAIGDQVNDLAMISAAGLGIAMANAVPAVSQAAKVHALSNDDDGVAHAIDRLLNGAW